MRRWIAEAALALYRRIPTMKLVPLICETTGIIVSPSEIRPIHDVLTHRRPCRLLVFGLGYDSLLWHYTNRGGRTVFIEDNVEWMAQMRRRAPELTVVPFTYRTRREDWRMDLQKSASLKMNLPSDVTDVPWDVIFVDAPAGYFEGAPGRLQSIYTAASLARPDTHVFVHDIDRERIRKACDTFLHPSDQVGQVGRLLHYHVSTPRSDLGTPATSEAT